jgi:hypothetical protein
MMTDDNRLVRGESRRAERVVRMNVCDQHVANGLVRSLPDFAAQPFAVRKTSARIGDQHAIAADNETDIGNTARVS